MPEGPAKAPAPNLQTLDDTYEIIGELRGSQSGRKYIGRRRSDGVDIVVTIVAPSEQVGDGDLSHYAADAQLLSQEHQHEHMVDVLDARWLDRGVLAVVHERVVGSTLGDMLDRGERLSNPRVAAVLQEVLGVLEWARERRVVHRGVTADSVFFEENSQRVIVELAPTPIPITGVPDACADAETIGALAWSMLAGKRYVPGERAPLSAIAPDLATRVIDATDQLVGCSTPDNPPDVPTVLGIIAAGDVLKQAEVEIAALKEEYEEQHRTELAKCENRRLEVEQQAAEAATALADERRDFDREIAEQRASLASDRQGLDAERAEFEHTMQERQAHFSSIRATLEQQAAELERRLSEFDERRTEFEEVVLERQREAVASGSSPDFVLTSTSDEQSAKAVRGVFAPLDARPTPPAPPPAPKGEPRRRSWKVPALVSAAALAIVAAVAGVMHERGRSARDTIVVGKTTFVPRPPSAETRSGLGRAGFFSQSAGGTVDPGALGTPIRRNVDSAATPPADTQTAVAAQPERASRDPDVGGNAPMQAPSSPRPEQRETTARTSEPMRDRVVDHSISNADSVVRITGTRRDTIYIRGGNDTVYRSGRRDTTMKRDTGRPDSVRFRPATRPP